jgi:hypothetical protein
VNHLDIFCLVGISEKVAFLDFLTFTRNTLSRLHDSAGNTIDETEKNPEGGHVYSKFLYCLIRADASDAT